MLTAASIVGDLVVEMRTSLRCLALDPEGATAVMDEMERALVAAGRRGLLAIDRELPRVAKRLAEIPLRKRTHEVPKVLLFGGINRIFVDKPVREFLEQRDILAKTNDISEFISLLEFEWMNRSGFAHGHLHPEEHYSVSTILADLAAGPDRSASLRALRARVHCQVIEWLERRWHRLAARSGLLFTGHIPFRVLAREAHDIVSWNGYTEAPCTVGRYFSCLRANGFDGYVNVGAFNCAPANTATALISALSRRANVPYAAIEADGTTITPSQIRQLETVAAQCLRQYAGRSSGTTV